MNLKTSHLSSTLTLWIGNLLTPRFLIAPLLLEPLVHPSLVSSVVISTNQVSAESEINRPLLHLPSLQPVLPQPMTNRPLDLDSEEALVGLQLRDLAVDLEVGAYLVQR